MNNYAKLKMKQQKEFNQLPIGAAFSDSQFNEMMKNWGLDSKNEEDLKKVSYINSGTFIQKKDLSLLNQTMEKFDKEMKDAMNADTTGDSFLYEMFLYELDNHEYGYTGELEETLDCLGYTVEEINADARLLHALRKATKEINEREDF